MSDGDQSATGGWGRLGTILLILAALAIFGFALVGPDRVEHLFGVDLEGWFESYVTETDTGP